MQRQANGQGGDGFLRDDWARGDSIDRARQADPYLGTTGVMHMDIESDNHTVTAVPPRPYR